ncbi:MULTISPECIES: hypothetical protein [Rahnella]|mgnify:CR=1 FL=1|jgi:hypothetical protein|uniref:Nucleotidyl transferase AbiEii/AbiGii toxin family protein n=2 Tax=Rahnella sp. (strain Y9602) TaxID=2703885 RepID=A0A0H3FFJ5_RAHSY|nr:MULTISPECIES: hypothetical protein [Rahnella]AFE60341.1 hypothetical protein Q7S_20660 [Rahnella aquatilis HX2]AYA08927.1 hypothetical protein D3Z09_21225 [Rahnella aquatilis]ADW75654.1 hypothetical protein Rahaq_4066 [Rahnella aceris]AZP44102.1 hypothetical protein EJP79_20535 [Rahnella aquatilis]AZP48439.1 hypothetical protein EJP81_20535 [Rahnella aquatilis]
MDEIRGLKLFGEYFKKYQDQYVLIGGVASWITMDEAGEEFRATKDLDIVLIIEALSPDFVSLFWEFIKSGNYEIRQTGEGKPIFYRFLKPENTSYPFQIELFSRSPQGMEPPEDAQIIPIPKDEGVSSLSAILLDEHYYSFLRDGLLRTELFSYIGADRLIPLKMNAWLDLSTRKAAGEPVDSRVVNKHRNDVIRLSGQLTGKAATIPENIRADMESFLTKLSDENIDLRSLNQRGSVEDVIKRIREGFGL